MDLSSRVEDVAWMRLEHAYDDATDLPALLRGIGVAEHPDQIVGMLRDRLVHQGHVVYSATVEAVPILVDMVSDGSCPARPAIVRLIGDLAAEAARVGAEQETKVRWSRMWRGKLPLMADLLRDDDVEVRRAAPAPLASAEFDQDRLLERLLEAYAAERDEPARLGQLTAVADLLPAVPPAVRALTVDRAAEIVSGGSPQVRMAGAFVLRQVEPVGAGVFLDALRAPDVEQWRRTWCVPGRRQSIVSWVDQRLREDRDLRLALGKGLVASADAATRVSAFDVLMRVASRWRSPMVDVAAAGFHALDDPDEAVSSRALFALAVSRSREPEHADRLAELAEGPDGYPRLAAIWGLARMGDSRCVPHLLSSLRSAHLGYRDHQVYEANVSRPVLPSVDEILLEAAAWSDRLLSGVLRRLAGTPAGAERRALLRTVAGWGPKAGAALPVLVDGLATPDPTLEIIALAAIGATATDVPIGLLRPAFQRVSAAPGVDRLTLIRAYTRITADVGPVLAELPDAGSDEPLSDSALHLIGALGPAGADYAGRLEQLLPGLGRWATLGAARSHWEITGQAGPGGRALTGILVDLERGRPAVRADLLALTQTAEMGFADPALVSVLWFLVRAEARVTGPAGGWQSIDLDETMAGTARRILDAGERAVP
ncbi:MULTISPECIES: HEAT repeat domain-containing protein [unclassified Micromonospora]|uniref:HEAT repeat domain-containing protein n=1 Tax=unclassified Micromonospora TaxID=2617518 RepID=UPI001B365372|nr:MULTISPECIES: HEAT repeat domain-containing protein [unclassified Micromonospora]MBQ1043550.1 HEAT repeat domain-containing protein [Micromonospora sp. C72]MBQ1053541.1 HEAT repeat domain-containing protein [Micromonospora sp. C32]